MRFLMKAWTVLRVPPPSPFEPMMVVAEADVERRAQDLYETYGTSRWDDLPTDARAVFRRTARIELRREAEEARSMARHPAGSKLSDPVQALCDLADALEDDDGRYLWDHASEVEIDQHMARLAIAIRRVRDSAPKSGGMD
jgi:hypothetical protein